MTRGVTLLDGGMGRELERIGAPFRLPEWSALALIEAPAMVSEAHARFVAAGADIITANSYALTPHQLGEARFTADARMLADRAGRIARASAGTAVRVAGSLPPLFGSYMPERFDPARAPAILAPLVEGLAPHVDLWLVETTSSIAEMHAAADAARPVARPLWVSYTLADGIGRTGPPALRSGEGIAAATAQARERGAEAVLFNCSQAEAMLPAIELAVAAGGVSVGAYANAFLPEPADGDVYAGISELRGDLGPIAYRRVAADWIAAGASVVGGCCGIGPPHIAELRRWLDEREADIMPP